MSHLKTHDNNPVCPECNCKDTVKKGKRRNRLQTLQLFQCIECLHKFTGAPGKNRSYSLKHILEAVSMYNRDIVKCCGWRGQAAFSWTIKPSLNSFPSKT